MDSAGSIYRNRTIRSAKTALAVPMAIVSAICLGLGGRRSRGLSMDMANSSRTRGLIDRKTTDAKRLALCLALPSERQ